MTWLGVWTRAVVVAAARRAGGTWVGAGVIAAVVFGPTGMHPRDVTSIAWHEPLFAAVLCLTWVLVFLPTARVLVRGDTARFLTSLPAPRITPRLVGALALLLLQLPWFTLWIVGEGARGAAVATTTTVADIALARIRASAPRTAWPDWPTSLAALRAINVRSIRRRASDAVIRGIGLAILGGLFSGLFIRNNQLADAAAASLGAAIIAIALVPAQVGPLLAILDAHRQAGWLASSLGISPVGRLLALVQAIALVYLTATCLAVSASTILIGAHASTILWLASISLLVALGAALAMARVLTGSEHHPFASSRTVVGAIAVAALAGLLVGIFGATLGATAFFLVGAFAVVTLR
ncbi:MAG: hypothetical protein SFX73_25260 [Kofleriaceae bacterium]|nr:hypothetical protein [Kofleriaceae bacterium]